MVTAPPSGPDEGDMSGLVLAGGASRRMGTDKAMLVVEGANGRPETLLERAIRHLREADADPVLVASGTRGRYELPPGVAEVDDGDARGSGPLAGVGAGLRRSTAPVVAVVAVDLPDASPALLQWLRTQWRPTDRGLIPLDGDGRAQPLHALLARDLAGFVMARIQADERRVLPVLAAGGARTVAVPAEFGRAWARNVNTPEDLSPAPPQVGSGPPWTDRHRFWSRYRP